jgi:hypothetical protein
VLPEPLETEPKPLADHFVETVAITATDAAHDAIAVASFAGAGTVTAVGAGPALAITPATETLPRHGARRTR